MLFKNINLTSRLHQKLILIVNIQIYLNTNSLLFKVYSISERTSQNSQLMF